MAQKIFSKKNILRMGKDEELLLWILHKNMELFFSRHTNVQQLALCTEEFVF